MTKPLRRIRELDGLRAIAILLVLGCHYPGFARTLSTFPTFGWVGVDIFFALSGYLITSILLGLRGHASPYKTFYSRRFIRIIPPYAATLLLIVLLGVCTDQFWVLNPSFLAKQVFFLQAFRLEMRVFVSALLRHPLWQIGHMPSLLQNAHHLPVGWVGATILLGTAPFMYWSLSVEEYFYLLWAPIVLRCSRSAIVWIGVAICLIDIFLRWGSDSIMALFGIVYRFDALIYGAFLALLIEYWNRTSVRRWSLGLFYSLMLASAVGLAAILFAIRPILTFDPRASPLFMALGLPMISIGASAFIGLLILKADSDWWVARILRTSVLQYLGTISYTMYLVHIIAAWIIVRMAMSYHLSDSSLFLQAVLSTILTVFLARLSWHYLEKPLLRWKDKRFPNAPHPVEPPLN